MTIKITIALPTVGSLKTARVAAEDLVNAIATVARLVGAELVAHISEEEPHEQPAAA